MKTAFILLLTLLSSLCAAPTPDLLWLPLDEGSGTFAADRSPNRLEADLTNVQWAKGAFGTAARFSGSNSFIELPPVPSLNGATQCTISVWATWEGTGRYPNLLTTHTWSPGGLMFFVNNNSCSFRLGRPGPVWSETSASFLNTLPLRQWTHLCAVFALPNINTYVNGKPAGKGTWRYPIAADALRIGRWANSVSHNGLISDLRIYSRALMPSEIDFSARGSADYTLVKESPQLAAKFENRRAELSIDTQGRVVSLRSKGSKRELLAHPQELISAKLKDGRQLAARKASFRNGALTFEFPRGEGAAVLAVDARKDHFTFTIRSLTLPDVAALTFFNVPVTTTKYRGTMANMLSDDTDAVCLRGYDLPVEMSTELKVWTTAEHGLTGWRAGLAVGPKKEMPMMLRAMAADAGVPVSKLGGAWSLGAEANRGSYLFADLSLASVDDWIELARRGGFTHIHMHGWWKTLGHYGVNTNLFPRGLTDMKDTVARIHAAGLKAGIHTLTACIDTRDSWVTPEASSNLIAAASYTLARAISPIDTVIYVNEKPIAQHDVVFTYSGRGNAIRIGSEIIQYSEVLSDGFAKCQRGTFKTRPAAHAAGEQADYLQQRYMAFYPKPGSPLADELADCIANVFNTCKLDQIYFDGSEGMMSRYGIDFMRHAIFKRLRGEVLVEASCWGAHNWWFHSRLGAWDHSVWAAKRFQDLHIASDEKFRHSDLLEPQMGWWAPRAPSTQARGHFLDEMEYFAGKNLGLDSAMSIQGVNVTRQPLPFHIEKQMTVLGWYERLRLARYFDTQTVARVAVPGDEFRLRQDRDGAWKFTPVKMSAHRVTQPGSWKTKNPFTEQPLSARIEALYSAAPYDSPKRICLTGDTNLCLRAENKSATRRSAWTKTALTFAPPYRNITGTGALGVWVKGDGKGALLNIQLASPREYMSGRSDHYVTLDFTGWRYFELLFRERDVDQMHKYQWPYSSSYTLYRTGLDLAHISELNLYLNNLPPSETTEVVIRPIMALPVQPAELKNPSLTVNGKALSFPVTMKSGDFLELEPTGECAHYNDKGDSLASLQPVAAPALRAGENTIALNCARAEVTINSFGVPFGTLNPRRKQIAREYDMPRWISGPTEWDLPVRPGERAKLELELTGAMDTPVLTVNGREFRFPVTLKPGERLICRDQRHWVVTDAKRKTIAKGELPAALPVLKGGPNRIAFTCAAPDRAQVKLVKEYD
ncbi:MAG: hypothetical protein FJ395_18295 [Verrucomicrobia bacterium]|nr:hypothetical protein [Verrucomicrobiota bacterium]